MAKDMSRVYGEMLTKELVKLRAKKREQLVACNAARTLHAMREAENVADLISQINNELAERVATMSIFA